MKVGIISINMYSKGLNFACPLHTYAFQQLLLTEGFDATVIDYRPVYYNDFDLRHPDAYYERLCREYEASGRSREGSAEWERRVALRAAWHELHDERERRHDAFQRFIDAHYVKTDACFDSDLFEVWDPGFDCYVCCSDVIWKHEPGWGFDRGFLLASRCMEGKGKVAYAASRELYGDETEADDRELLRCVANMDAVSVREDSLRDYLLAHGIEDVTTVLDPVLLQGRGFWEDLAEAPRAVAPGERFLVLYHVVEPAPELAAAAATHARRHGLTVVELTERPLKHGLLAGEKDIRHVYPYDIGPEEWLGYLAGAECVFTNSFHACCFGILFGRELYVGRRSSDKLSCLLATFGLEGRALANAPDPEAIPPTDHGRVARVLEERRSASRAFILDALRRLEMQGHLTRGHEFRHLGFEYPLWYNSGRFADVACEDPGSRMPTEQGPDVTVPDFVALPSGSLELRCARPVRNDGSAVLAECRFERSDHDACGWQLRLKVDNRWFWLRGDGTLALAGPLRDGPDPRAAVLAAGEHVPVLPVNRVRLAVAVAHWRSRFALVLNGGSKQGDLSWDLDEDAGELSLLQSGSVEWRMRALVSNDGLTPLPRGPFARVGHRMRGWRVRAREGQRWYWLLEDGTTAPAADGAPAPPSRLLVADGGPVPPIPLDEVATVVLEAVWEPVPAPEQAPVSERGPGPEGRGLWACVRRVLACVGRDGGPSGRA